MQAVTDRLQQREEAGASVGLRCVSMCGEGVVLPSSFRWQGHTLLSADE